MQALILLAVVGLCRAGGIPVSADYSISTHGPDRSFSLVHKSRAVPTMLASHADKMVLGDARSFMTNDWDWKKTLLDDPSLVSPLIARNAWAPRTMAFADPRVDLLAKGLGGCIDCAAAPTVSTVVTRTVHKPEIEKHLLAAPMGIEKSLLFDKLKLDRAIAERGFVNSMLARKVMADSVVGVPLEKELLADKLISDKLWADKVFADKFATTAISTPLDITGKGILASAAPFGWANDKAVIDARMALGHDPWLQDKALLASKWTSPMAFADKDLLSSPWGTRALTYSDKALLAPFGAKTMLIKK